MSAHFDKYGLNTYYAAPYFQAHIPADYPLSLVIQKSRVFRRLPPRLRELSTLAKRWANRVYPFPGGINDIDRWYDADGYELNPETGRRLSDEEIDAEWERWDSAEMAAFVAEDIPLPTGGFADPETWEEPVPEEEVELVDRGLTEAGVLGDIASRGRARTAEEYGVPVSWLARVTSDEDLAHMILGMEGKPWPARDESGAPASE